jgi:hypothetical protein
MEATIGRVVHWQPPGSRPDRGHAPRAALVTAVSREGEVSLAVFQPAGLAFVDRAPHSEQPRVGHWSWPPRV